ARAVERMGYARYWIAEHHGTGGLASSAPEVLIGQVAATTSRMRVGAGGIMLPNHAPLRVAETFRSLEALFPDRIDLGLGRAPGADPVTAFALRRTQGGFGGEDFTGQIAELLAYAEGGFPDDHPFRHVRAVPTDAPLPPLWILGASSDSAALAAALGVGYAFARHLGPRRATEAMRLYRERFEPSPALDRPRAVLAASVVCAPTAERAEELAASLGLWVVRARQGRTGDLPTP
ncbi:MAG: MsnO8 family LLM class oxidoreductase, partial [Miltoncostaeaceae bacterium]